MAERGLSSTPPASLIAGPFAGQAEALLERASWLKATAAYLRQMAEVEYMLLNADSHAVLNTLNRVLGMPDPQATLEAVDHLLDVAAEYTHAAARIVEREQSG